MTRQQQQQQQQQLIPGHIIDQTYQIHRLLGAGAYAHVYLARDVMDDDDTSWYAIKSLPPCLHAKQRGLQRTEIGLHARLSSHPNIISLEKVIRLPSSSSSSKAPSMDAVTTHMVLEYSPEGDLFTCITERNLYANQPLMIQHVFLQLIHAVRHCHQSGVYHRDLKSENILVFDGGWTVKLGDFGLATTDTISKDYGCGSTFYFSPECQGDFDEQRLGYATAPNDMWSLGIILINLMTGRNPWHRASIHDPAFRMYMMDPSILMTMLPSISAPVHAILKQLLSIDPLQRMSLDQLEQAILQCPTFTNNNSRMPPINITKSQQQQQQQLLPSPPTTPNRPSFVFVGKKEEDDDHDMLLESDLDEEDDDDDNLLFSPLETPVSQQQPLLADNEKQAADYIFLSNFSTLAI
ncbi:kinase-like domain-containing protein [Absidia repens]|uniref:Kinase-like domain-containing protein n=1 Tax=Absidia repens TaxID=90262 RepID=A0A1X2I2P6_9FUNG|nr:kinase-like domain-containing protein [Absidia repens]